MDKEQAEDEEITVTVDITTITLVTDAEDGFREEGIKDVDELDTDITAIDT